MSDGRGRPQVRLTPPPRVDPVGASPPPAAGRRGGRGRRFGPALAVLGAVALGGILYLLSPAPATGPPAPGVADSAGPQVERGGPPIVEDPAGAAGGSSASSPSREAGPIGGAKAASPPPDAFASSGAAPRTGGVEASAPGPPPPATPEAGTPPPEPPPDPVTLQRAELERLRRTAAEHEIAEEWPRAVAAYEAALKIEPTATFARVGAARAAERAALARRLEDHLSHPERLSAEAVLEEAREVVDRAAAVAEPGPRHRRQLAGLREMLAAAATPVPVELISDGETEVVVHHVGRLGRFTRRELELRPGEYTVVGSRRGYRDVRLRLRVEPGAAPARLVVSCRERV